VTESVSRLPYLWCMCFIASLCLVKFFMHQSLLAITSVIRLHWWITNA
jgi:hypothetical protein